MGSYYTWYDRFETICICLFFLAFTIVLFLLIDATEKISILESEVSKRVSANRIGRTIERHECKIQYVTAENEIKEDSVTVWGHLPPKSIDKKLSRITGHDRLLVTEISTERFYASMPIEEFIEHASIIERPNEED